MQNNLVKNAKYLKNHQDEIEYFNGQGYYLGQKVSGYLTCVAMENYPYPITQSYALSIPTIEKKMVLFGYTMRAIRCDEATLVVTFYDEDNKPIGQKEKDISSSICSYYTPIMEKFYLPKTCASVKVQVRFEGNIKGLSFFAPTVYVL